MIDMKQAVQVAQDFCRTLYGQEQLTDFLLEEVELTEDEKFWLVTIGFSVQPLSSGQTATGSSAASSSRGPAHVYKTMKVDASSGRALSLKIKKL